MKETPIEASKEVSIETPEGVPIDVTPAPGRPSPESAKVHPGEKFHFFTTTVNCKVRFAPGNTPANTETYYVTQNSPAGDVAQNVGVHPYDLICAGVPDRNGDINIRR